MPSSGRGGKRSGKPGQSYPNRTDMAQAPRAVPGQPYGQAGAQLQAQQQMPLPQQGLASAPTTPPAPQPGALGPLHAPTDRPAEPITAGLTQGAGPGPEAIGVPAPVDPTVNLLKGMMQAYPNADLQAILNQALAKNA